MMKSLSVEKRNELVSTSRGNRMKSTTAITTTARKAIGTFQLTMVTVPAGTVLCVSGAVGSVAMLTWRPPGWR